MRGDELKITIANVGSMTVDVIQGNDGAYPTGKGVPTELG
jgi:hypothetical protein